MKIIKEDFSMKALIWIVCIFVFSLVKTLLFGNKALGAIPSVIFYGIAFGVAGKLSKAWEEHKNNR